MKIFIPFLLLFIASCSSVGSGSDNARQFYLLEASTNAKNSIIDGKPIASIRRVNLPDYLSDNKGVVRQDGDGKIRISSLHNWAESLDTRVPKMLAMEISTILEKPVDLHPVPPGHNIPFIVEVEILDMLGGQRSDDSVQFEFNAKYRIIGTETLNSYRFNTNFKLKTDSVESIVKANSQAIQALAKDISTHLK